MNILDIYDCQVCGETFTRARDDVRRRIGDTALCDKDLDVATRFTEGLRIDAGHANTPPASQEQG